MPGILGNLYAICYSALRARQFELETTSDNLANINTIGFKGREARFQAASRIEDGGLVRAGVQFGDSVANFSQGPVQPTGETWDLAIDGAGFFRLRLPDGQIGYSRVGSFHPDGLQQLVSEQGFLLEPPITLPEGAEGITVDGQGIITALQGGLPVEIGRLELARFENPEGLAHMGDGIYLPSVASGPPVAAAPLEDGLGQILSRALEMSNVDPSQQMVNIVQVQRAYGLALRALQVSDQMAAITNQLEA